MRRKMALILTITFLLSTFSVNSMAAVQVKNIFKIKVNGTELKIPAVSEPYLKNDKIMVPVLVTSQAFGFVSKLYYLPDKLIFAYKKDQPDQILRVLIDEKRIITTEGETIEPEIPLEVKNKIDYIYLDYVAKGMNSSLSTTKSTDTNGNTVYNINLKSNIKPYDCVDKAFAKTAPPQGLQRYSTETGKITWEFLGSLTNNNAQKFKGSSKYDDVEILRKLLVGTSFTLSDEGYFQTGSINGFNDISDNDSGFVIKRTDLKKNVDGHIMLMGGNYPAIDLSDWGITKNEETFLDTRVLMNFALEVFKFYSIQKTDGEQLWKFLDDNIKARKNIDLSKEYTFGKTKVKFYETPFNGFGVYIVFLTFSQAEKTQSSIYDTDTPPDNVKRYSNENGKIEWDILGKSLINPSCGTRQPNSLTESDRTKLLVLNPKDSKYHIKEGDSNNSDYQIERADIDLDNLEKMKVMYQDDLHPYIGDYPLVKIKNWARTKEEEKDEYKRFVMNYMLEVLKFYSVQPSDGENIWLYVDQIFKKSVNIEEPKILDFGKTKVVFYPDSKGIMVAFVTNKKLKVSIDSIYNQDKEPQGILRYDSYYGRITGTKAGMSLTNPACSKTQDNLMLDIESLNALSTFYKIDANGNFKANSIITNPSIQITRTDMKIGKDNKLITSDFGKYSVVRIKDWIIDPSTTKYSQSQEISNTDYLNYLLEIFKFFSIKPSDAENLWLYVNSCESGKETISLGKDIVYGKTTYKIFPGNAPTEYYIVISRDQKK